MRITTKLLITACMFCFVSIVAQAKEATTFSVKNVGTDAISLQLTNVR